METKDYSIWSIAVHLLGLAVIHRLHRLAEGMWEGPIESRSSLRESVTQVASNSLTNLCYLWNLWTILMAVGTLAARRSIAPRSPAIRSGPAADSFRMP